MDQQLSYQQEYSRRLTLCALPLLLLPVLYTGAFLRQKAVLASALAALLIAAGVCLRLHIRSVSYEALDEDFANPLLGYAPMIWEEDGLAEDVRLVYVPIRWRDLEPEEGVYDWEKLESRYFFSSLRERGIHLVIRFLCDYPSDEDHLDIPDWLYEKTGGSGTHYACSYGMGYSPDYSDPVFREAHRRVVSALGERYGGDTFISYIELGVLGHWGEWHVNTSAGVTPLPDAAVREEYVSAWTEAFPNAAILMRRPFTQVKTYGLGVYNDMVGVSADTEAWLDWIDTGEGVYQGEEDALAAVPRVWNTAPVGGEFASVSMEDLLVTRLDNTLSLIRESHMTFLGPCTADASYAEGYAAVHRSLGYRLAVTGLTVRSLPWKTEVTLQWTNTGAAPMYWDWPVTLYLEDAEGNTVTSRTVDIRLSELTPGTRTRVTVTFDRGLTALLDAGGRLTLGIADPMTGSDCVRLAVQVPWENGRNRLL